jgi:hypothetical protein
MITPLRILREGIPYFVRTPLIKLYCRKLGARLPFRDLPIFKSFLPFIAKIHRWLPFIPLN